MPSCHTPMPGFSPLGLVSRIHILNLHLMPYIPVPDIAGHLWDPVQGLIKRGRHLYSLRLLAFSWCSLSANLYLNSASPPLHCPTCILPSSVLSPFSLPESLLASKFYQFYCPSLRWQPFIMLKPHSLLSQLVM